MKPRWKGLAIALAALCGSYLLFRLAAPNQTLMTLWVQAVAAPYQRAMGFVCGLVPFSMAEVCWAVLILGCAWYLGKAVYDVIRAKGFRPQMALRKVLGACVIALSVYMGYTLLWGAQYYAVSFEQQAGLAEKPVSVQQLTQVTQLFAARVNEAASGVQRNEDGVCSEEIAPLLAQSAEIYTVLEQQYPFLQRPHRPAKPMLFSRLMSEMNYTGFFFPFTGEANVNIEEPRCFLASTLAHEQAHLRGVAPEQTANFVAILACETSGNPAYRYSGDLLAYLHLSNALFSADRQAWEQISATLCPEAQADLADNNTYWQQFETPVAAVANSAYEGFLQGYDQALGLQSYGAVVDLLVAYYGQA